MGPTGIRRKGGKGETGGKSGEESVGLWVEELTSPGKASAAGTPEERGEVRERCCVTLSSVVLLFEGGVEKMELERLRCPRFSCDDLGKNGKCRNERKKKQEPSGVSLRGTNLFLRKREK